MNVSGISGGSSATGRVANESLKSLNMDDFLQLMISELQNQDPLNPMDNTQMLQQVSQIREIAASESLSETLQAVLFGQNVTNATSLIGKQVKALNAEGEFITGGVEKVAIADGDIKVFVSGQAIKLNNVSEILP